MIQRPKVKWVAPIVLCGALIAGSSVAIAAATWSDSEGDASFDLPLTGKPSLEDIEARKAEIKAEMQARKAEMQARKAEMQERLAARVESGEITQAEADAIREKMAERRAKLEQRKGEKRG